MELAPGAQLGPYVVIAPLGVGGMGEVYKARDTRLDRTLALKILPADAADAEHRQRFIREARAASSLNHPNIVHIYDIGEAEGTQYIAMEHVAGVTLQQKIGVDGLGLADLLAYALQISDALAKAHAAGIVHRDLKPANVMITADGVVKILDFGIAKLVGSIDFEAATRTGTARLTLDHVLIGSAAYMSPEQAQGRTVDRRSDIFSLGTVLYEMATGRPAFQQASTMSTIAAVIHDEPTPIASLTSRIPAALDQIVSKCLRKDPGRRFQHMDDVNVALLELKEQLERGESRDRFGTGRRPTGWSRSVTVRLAIALAATVAVIGVFVLRSLWTSPRQAEPGLRRMTFDSGLTTDPAFSPDGRLLAYASDRAGNGGLDLWVQQMPDGHPIRRTSDETDESEPAFSPDGTHIAFRSERNGGGIYLIDALGGTPSLIAPKGHTPRFSPDGNWIVYWLGVTVQIVSGGIPHQLGEMYVVAASGGNPRPISPEFAVARYPVWSPDSRHVLFVGERSADHTPGDLDWWIAPIDGGNAVASGAWRAFDERKFGQPVIPSAWDKGGVLLSARSGDSTNLWRLPVSAATGHVEGAPERLTFGSALELQPSETTDGRVAFASVVDSLDVWQVPIDADRGRPTGPIARLSAGVSPALFASVDRAGTRAAFWSERSGTSRLWLLDLASGTQTELIQAGAGQQPLLSPDGAKVAYSTNEQGHQVIKLFSGPEDPARTVCVDCSWAFDWSLDGRRIVYGLGSPTRLAELDLVTGRSREIARHDTYNLYQARVAPDGRWLAFHATNNPNVRQVFVMPLGETSTSADAWIPITPPVFHNVMPSWSPDGGMVYFVSDRDGYWCVWAQTVDPTKHPVGDPVAVLHQHSARVSIGDVTAGPRIGIAPGRLLFSAREHTGNIWTRER